MRIDQGASTGATQLTVLVPERRDLAIMKLARGYEHDLQALEEISTACNPSKWRLSSLVIRRPRSSDHAGGSLWHCWISLRAFLATTKQTSIALSSTSLLGNPERAGDAHLPLEAAQREKQLGLLLEPGAHSM